MKVLKNNKGLIIFYLSIAVFTILWVSNVEANNDRMMIEKNSYILSDNL